MIYGLSRPLKHSNVDLVGIEPYIENLFLRMKEGSVIIMKCSNSPPVFFQFSSYNKGNQVLLEFGFPKVEWSEKFYPTIKSSFNDNKIIYELESQNPKFGIGVEEFLTVYEVENSKLALQLVEICCEAISLDSPIFTISYDGGINPNCGRNTKNLPFISKSEMIGFGLGRFLKNLLKR